MRRSAGEGAPSNPLALSVALAAFTVCFFAWSMFGPLGPTLQTELHLSDFQLAFVVALPVVLGSVMRIPIGILAGRFGGRRVFTALMAYSVLPLVLLALFHDSFGAVVAFGFLLGVTGASFAVGVPFVSGWYAKTRQGFALGIYGMGMGGTVIAALTAPKIAKHWSLATPFWVATVLMVAMTVIFWFTARDAPAPAAASGPLSFTAPLRVFRRSGRAWGLTLFYFLSFGGFVAMFLYLPKLLTGVHHLAKTDAGYRARASRSWPCSPGPSAAGWLIGSAGGLGGFFPPLAMAIIKSATGSYALGFVLFAVVAIGCLAVLFGLNRRPTDGRSRLTVAPGKRAS